jgi:hypothetical protein
MEPIFTIFMTIDQHFVVEQTDRERENTDRKSERENIERKRHRVTSVGFSQKSRRGRSHSGLGSVRVL